MKLGEIFTVNQELYIATCGKDNKPRNIIVIGKGMYDNKALFGLCSLNGKTLANLKENPQVSVIVKNELGYFRVDGEVEFHTNNKVFDKLISLCNPPLPQIALLIKVSEVVNLDNGENVKIES